MDKAEVVQSSEEQEAACNLTFQIGTSPDPTCRWLAGLSFSGSTIFVLKQPCRSLVVQL